MHVHLPSGERVVIRPIRSADKLLLADGLRRLRPETVHQRFLAPKPRLTRRELRYLTEVDGVDHVAVVAVLERRPDVIVASARWVRDADDPESAEIAVVVADDLQGQGLGTLLGEVLAAKARELGIRRFTATMLASNEPAHRLFARISGRLAVSGGEGTHELVAELAA